MQSKLKLIVAAAATLCGSAAMAQDMVVKIGHVGPVSGAQAHYGKDNENGARMAIDDLNKKGVTIGGKKVKLELVAEDDAADPKQGTAAAQKLCDAKVNGVVGHLNSGTTIPASTVYNQCGIPHVTPSATNPKLTQQGYKTTFRMLANDNALGAGLALHAANNLKLKKVAVIDDRTAYGQGVAEVFKKTAQQKGIQVVDEQFTTDKATDFMAILTAIKSKAPDGVFYGGMDPQAGPMLRQMEQLGMSNVKFFGGDGICTAKLAELSGGAKSTGRRGLRRGWFAVAGQDARRQGLEGPLRRQVPEPVPGLQPVRVRRGARAGRAMVKAGSADPKVYLPKLAETNYQGVTTKVAFEPDGELKEPGHDPVHVQGWQEGAAELI
jgi:branched-chain amino acid transport system substrate-binding protein